MPPNNTPCPPKTVQNRIVWTKSGTGRKKSINVESPRERKDWHATEPQKIIRTNVKEEKT